jgi:hypothetical protein
MKRPFLLLASALLAATFTFAQDVPSDNPPNPSQAPGSNAQVIRGCLSGSAGNYTLTDPNGMQYQVSGDEATLRSMVGHEVEITGAESATTAQRDDTRPANAIEASDVRAVSDNCNNASPQSAAPDNITPPPDRDSNVAPKGTPGSTEPPKPQLISMVQQQSAPDAGTQEPKADRQQPKAGTRKSSPESEMNAQTTPNSPASAKPQIGDSPANRTGMTETEANDDAQAARQSELNNNPKTDKDTGRGIDNQGVNNPSQTKPEAVPQSRHTADPGSTAQSSQQAQQAPEQKRPEHK